jgi:hypothetical protein
VGPGNGVGAENVMSVESGGSTRFYANLGGDPYHPLHPPQSVEHVP